MADSSKSEQIILAAIAAAGPAPRNSQGALNGGRWHAQIKELAVEIALMLDEKSPISRAITRIEAAEKPFVVTVLGGSVEASSTRAVIRFVAEKGDGNEEEIRTERTDTADGRAMLEKCKALKGHRALFYKYMDDGNDGRKYRLLVHAVDLGVAEQPQAAAA